MSLRTSFWTRKLELKLVEFVRQRRCIWQPAGYTNYHIQLRYKAYAEIAAKLGRGFTARSVRDRWVNIRCTFHHNLRRVDKSKANAKSKDDIYIPCWPLWKPLQFLLQRQSSNQDEDMGITLPCNFNLSKENLEIKNEHTDLHNMDISIHESTQRTNRPRRTAILHTKSYSTKECKRVINDLIIAMKPLVSESKTESMSPYWFLGKHVTERLNMLRPVDAECATREILNLLENWSNN